MSLSIDIDNYSEIYKKFIKNSEYDYLINFIKQKICLSHLSSFIDELFINYSDKSYKYNNLYNIFNEIFIKFFSTKDKINKNNNHYKNNYEIDNVFYSFLNGLIKINNSTNILYKLETDFSMFISNHKYTLFLTATKYGTLRSVIFFSKFHDNFNDIAILKNSLYNSDDRVYKYIIKDLNFGIKISSNPYNYYNCLTNILSNRIPDKYKLRRIKYISNYINIDNYECIYTLIANISNYDLMYNILKYNLKINNIGYNEYIKFYNHILDICFDSDYQICKKRINDIYNLLCSSNEQNLFYITFSIKYNNSFGHSLIKSNINYGKYMHRCYMTFDKKINNRKFIKDIDYDSYYTFINYVIKSSLVFDFKIFSFYRYVDIWTNDMDNNIKNIFYNLNNAFYYINKYISNKVKIYSLKNKINKIKHNWNKPSISIKQNITSKFNYIPPYHLLPNQLNIIESVLIKEKADGELCFKLPSNIEPRANFINKIKAEYIEELDLYLVFDIDIDKNVKERYRYLRSLHPSILNNNLDVIYDWDDLINCINIERNNLQKFLNKPYKSYRWYPKAAWEIINFDNIMTEKLISIVCNNSVINNWLCNNGPFKNDGFILTPLNGKREIKIKPKELLTIDLIYKDGKWCDRDEYNYNDIIKPGKFKDNTIYRCYPINNIYEAREIRHDKTKPNPRDVVNNLISLYNCDYNFSYNKLYYTKPNNNFNNDYEWNKIINDNIKYVKKNIQLLKNNHILDLGCGKGKLLKIINNYNSYYGLDFDMSNIIKATMKYNSNKNIFNYINLNRDWNNTINKLYKIDNKIFDTIYAINSLMHFCTDEFWKQLDNYVSKDTYFIFNLINNKLNKYNFGKKSYIERCGNEVKYFFEHVHLEPICETYISDEKLNYFLTKYNWKVVEKIIYSSNLNQYYTWYKVIHI
jgi:cyclopropane fatty-acyl-phospholipid synthase-like methyltransferase